MIRKATLRALTQASKGGGQPAFSLSEVCLPEKRAGDILAGHPTLRDKQTDRSQILWTGGPVSKIKGRLLVRSTDYLVGLIDINMNRSHGN